MNIPCFEPSSARLALRRQMPILLALLLTGLALGCHRKTPEEMLGEARDLFRNRDILSAELKYEDILKRFPDNKAALEAHLGLALCYRADNDYDRSREQLDQYIQKVGGPQTRQGFDALNMKLDTYLMQKKPALALQEALKTSDTLRTAPDQARQALQLKISELYQANKQEDKALAICQSLLTQWPKSPELHLATLEYMVRIHAAKRDLKKAVEVYQTYLASHPDTPNKAVILFGMGAYQKQMGDAAASERSLNASEEELHKQIAKALGADAKADLLMKLSRVQQFRQNFAGARQTLQQIIKDFPLSEYRMMAKMQLADLAMMEKKPQQAITILEEVIRDKPNSQWSYMADNGIQQIRAMLDQQKRTTGTQTTSGTLTRQDARPSSATLATTATRTLTEAPPAPTAKAAQP